MGYKNKGTCPTPNAPFSLLLFAQAAANGLLKGLNAKPKKRRKRKGRLMQILGKKLRRFLLPKCFEFMLSFCGSHRSSKGFETVKYVFKQVLTILFYCLMLVPI